MVAHFTTQELEYQQVSEYEVDMMQTAAISGDVLARSDFDILSKILKDKQIYPVYQPIVSLTDGEIFGYEALSRISDDDLQINIEQLFRAADKANRAWELEILCRTKALECAVNKPANKKLFLNVDPNIIYDDGFMNGFTRKRLDEYGLDFHDVIFEITERVAIVDNNAF